MFKNYVKVAWRNLTKDIRNSLLKILGLSIGIASSLLILIVVKFELSYEMFNKNYNHIYRIVTETSFSDGIKYNSGVSFPVPDAIRSAFPDFSEVAAIFASNGKQFTAIGLSDVAGLRQFIEPKGVFFVEADYYSIFDATWLAGNPQVLRDPDVVVLDRNTADKYFGDWRNALGGILKMDNKVSLKVSGILENSPQNTDLPQKIVISFPTLRTNATVFGYDKDYWDGVDGNFQLFIFKSNLNISNLNRKLGEFSKEHYENQQVKTRRLLLQPLSDYHFDSRFAYLVDHSISKFVLFMLSLMGLLIFLMAAVNFVNLSTAESIKRSREIGVRKVLGSSRRQLVFQIFVETSIIVILSTLIAAALAFLFFPYLREISNIPNNISLFSRSNGILLIVMIVVMIFLAGSYPALVLSKFSPISAIRNKISVATFGGFSLQRVLVIIQFVIAQVLIIGAVIAVQQMQFVQNMNLGFDKESVLVLQGHSDSVYLSRQQAFKSALLESPLVKSVSLSSDAPASKDNWSNNFYYNFSPKSEVFNTDLKYVDEDFVEVYDLKLVAGTTFSRSDTPRQAIVNETFVRQLGISNPTAIIGKSILMDGIGGWCPVVGVVKDFTPNTLKDRIRPLVIEPYSYFYSKVNIKLNTTQLKSVVPKIANIWNNYYPEYSFDSFFMDEKIDFFYKQESQLSLTYRIFAVIAIFISCFGLFGMVSFLAVQRTKEIAIRRVLGASVGSIIVSFFREFTLLVFISFIIAAPVAYVIMDKWLYNFAYHINFSFGVFLITLVGSIFISWIIIAYKAIMTARKDPKKALSSN